MSTFTQSRELPVDAAVACDLVLDWSRDPDWRVAVTAMEVTPTGRARAGQQIVERMRFSGLDFVTPTTITEATGTTATFTGASSTVRVSGRRSVTPLAEGACRVDIVVSVDLRGPLAPLTALLAPSYRRRHAADLDRLVELVSGAVASPGGG
ncbi:MAG TPA: SRPBCC family protein [Humibacillus sp.]|nr:SRPBCC family protein [Humibacillus sp.]